jgi:8-oxo-dGTP diphosphatase
MSQLPKVGVTVLIVKDGKILLGKRKGDIIGTDLYQTPGGHLENGESIVACGVRETMEETGLEIKNIRFSSLTNVTHFPPHHYVMIGLIADWSSGEAQVLEKDKCDE